MRRIASPPILAAIAVSACLAGPAAAQSDDPGRMDELKREFDRALEGLLGEVEPRIDSLSRMLDTLGRIDSLQYYREPEILPNGDIILRRKADAPPFEEKAPDGPRRKPAPKPGETPGIRL